MQSGMLAEECQTQLLPVVAGGIGSTQGASIMKLDGKVALITGAASGIGHAIAKRYLEAGARVIIADVDAAAAARAAGELAGETSAIGVRMDVSNEDEVNAGVARGVAT